MNVQKMYECAACARDYDDIDDAQTCCEPSIVYRCSCKKFYRDEQQANDCCQEPPERIKEQFDFLVFGD